MKNNNLSTIILSFFFSLLSLNIYAADSASYIPADYWEASGQSIDQGATNLDQTLIAAYLTGIGIHQNSPQTITIDIANYKPIVTEVIAPLSYYDPTKYKVVKDTKNVGSSEYISSMTEQLSKQKTLTGDFYYTVIADSIKNKTSLYQNTGYINILQPIPEPYEWAMLFFGLPLVWTTALRKNQSTFFVNTSICE